MTPFLPQHWVMSQHLTVIPIPAQSSWILHDPWVHYFSRTVLSPKVRLNDHSGEEHESRLYTVCSRQRMVLLHKFRYQTPADHKSGTFIRCMLHELTHMLAVSFPEIYGLTVEWLEMWACLKRISICQNGKWLTSIWRAIMSIIMKGCFIYWRYSLGVVDSACYLCKATISLVKGGGGKKINSMANHKPCLIRVTKWSPARCYTDCLILCAGYEEEVMSLG